MRREVELVTTGAELLIGRTVNRHPFVLGDRLGSVGLYLVRDTTVRDDAAPFAKPSNRLLDGSTSSL